MEYDEWTGRLSSVDDIMCAVEEKNTDNRQFSMILLSLRFFRYIIFMLMKEQKINGKTVFVILNDFRWRGMTS